MLCFVRSLLACRNEGYKLYDEVSFVIGHRGGRRFAEDITILPQGTIDSEVGMCHVALCSL